MCSVNEIWQMEMELYALCRDFEEKCMKWLNDEENVRSSITRKVALVDIPGTCVRLSEFTEKIKKAVVEAERVLVSSVEGPVTKGVRHEGR